MTATTAPPRAPSRGDEASGASPGGPSRTTATLLALLLALLGVVAAGTGLIGPLPIVLSLPFVFLLIRRPVLRRLATRNVARRPRETILVILGALLGTAIITSSYVVGDTLRSSIRRSATTQLGPVDELVVAGDASTGAAAHAAIAAAHLPGRDRTLTLQALVASAATFGPQPRAEPRAQVIETEFAQARNFGGDPSATGISGPTPSGTDAVVGADLASTLAVKPGDAVTISAYGATRQLHVVRVLPRLGVAGLMTLNAEGSTSPNVFVAPGTLAGLQAEGPAGGRAPPPTSLIAVSNGGGVVGGASRTTAMQSQLERAVAGLPVRVVTAKKTLLDNADQSGKQFTSFFQNFGYFSVLAGILLLVNIFVMLAQERKASLGMLRAVGLRRSSLVGSFSLEGWIYTLASAAAGALVGIGIGRLVVAVASKIFNNGADRNRSLDLHFTATAHSIQQGFTIGFVIALVTVVATSLYIARLNVIRAIRDLPEPPPGRPGPARRVGAILLVLGGVVLTASGIAGQNAIPALIGPAVAGAGLVPLLGRRIPRRPLLSVISILVLLWAVFCFSLIPGAFDKASIAVFVVQGVVLTAFAVVLVTPNQGTIGAAIRAVGGGARNMSLRLGLAYPLAKRFRTGLILSMYAIVVFVLTLLVTISHLFGGQLTDFTNKLSGGAAIVVESNSSQPAAADSVRSLSGVTWVFPATTTAGEFPARGSTDANPTDVVGFDRGFVGRGAPHLSKRPLGAGSDAAVYDAVATDPSKIIVSRDFHPGRRDRGGPPGAATKIGDVVTMRDPVTGASRRLTVAALAEEARYAGNDHVFIASTLAHEFFGTRATPNLLYVGTSAGTDNVSLATAINGRFLANGADARSFRQVVSDQLAHQQQFFTLIRGYVSLGLLVGIAGLGVVMVRAVRERRREIGVLRSLGFSGVAVRRAFVAESSFIALEGVAIGSGLALITCWRLVSSNTFGSHLPFSVPWPELAILIVGTLVASLIATAAPAQQASRIRPAVALRIAD